MGDEPAVWAPGASRCQIVAKDVASQNVPRDLLSGGKGLFYFSSEERIDFHSLSRERQAACASS